MKRFIPIVFLFSVLASICHAETLSAKGKVVDTTGKPVAGINVRAVLTKRFAYDYEEASYVTEATTTTGNDGRFIFNNLPKPDASQIYWSYDLIAYKPGEYLGFIGNTRYPLTSDPTTGRAPDGGYTIKVSKPGPYKGKVVDPKGNPIPGAEVSFKTLSELDRNGKPAG